MIIRSLDNNGDWTFGSGASNYLLDNGAIALNIETRLKSFLNDCFFASNEGLDWWNFLDKGYNEEMENAVTVCIAGSYGVIAINSYEMVNDVQRNYKFTYNIETIFSSSYINEISLPAPVLQ